jgi:16S rRNA (adenine1518-N6/adenine1519-N6)-dimethyltransferase
VVEIGPGRGALTGLLVGRAGRVVGVELDRDLCEGLTAALGDRIRVLNRDCLKVDLPALVREEGFREAALVGNLPYNITGAILQRILSARSVLSRAVLMVQREVARRMLALPGSRDYGVLSLSVMSACVPQKLFDLKPGSFSPAPRVHSSVVLLPLDAGPGIRIEREDRFFQVVRAAFGQRRKMLRNALLTLTAGDEAAVGTALARAEIDPRLRAECVSGEAFERLTQAFQPYLSAREGER